MEPVAFTARKDVHLLLLILAIEIETRAVGPGVHLDAAEINGVTAFADNFVNRFSGGEGGAHLIHVGEFDAVSDGHGAGIRLRLAIGPGNGNLPAFPDGSCRGRALLSTCSAASGIFAGIV